MSHRSGTTAILATVGKAGQYAAFRRLLAEGESG